MKKLVYFLSLSLLLISTTVFASPELEALFFEAVEYNQVNEVRKLLKKDFNINSFNENGDTALIFASREGFPKMVDLLLKDDRIDPDAQDDYFDMTALSFAAVLGKIDVVRVFLKKEFKEKINVNVRNGQDGTTALMEAINGNKFKITKLLMENPDVDVNVKDESHMTALMRIASSTYPNIEILELLLKRTDLDFSTKDLIHKKTAEELALEYGNKDVHALIKNN